jgi:hypothetical protein
MVTNAKNAVSFDLTSGLLYGTFELKITQLLTSFFSNSL